MKRPLKLGEDKPSPIRCQVQPPMSLGWLEAGTSCRPVILSAAKDLAAQAWDQQTLRCTQSDRGIPFARGNKLCGGR